MMWRDEIFLVTVTKGRNGYGEESDVDNPAPAPVLANKKSVRQSEFYQASTAGMKPEIMFEVRAAEYNNEPKLKTGDDVYFIIRTFSRNGETLELVCSRYPLR